MRRRETAFYEVEERKNKLNIVIAAVIVVTLLLTGTFFASKSDTKATAMTDLQTAESYQIGSITE